MATLENSFFIGFSSFLQVTSTYIKTPGEGALAGQLCTMREQRTAKLTLNSVFDILKLIPLFTVSSQKVTLCNVVN